MNRVSGSHMSGICTVCSVRDIPLRQTSYQLRNGWTSAYCEMKWREWNGLLLHPCRDERGNEKKDAHYNFGCGKKGAGGNKKRNRQETFKKGKAYASNHIRSIAQS